MLVEVLFDHRALFQRPKGEGLPASFQAATASFPEILDQAIILLTSLEAPIDPEACQALYGLPLSPTLLFLGLRRRGSSSSNMGLVTTFSRETKWILNTSGSLVGVKRLFDFVTMDQG
jgi:hypothetical protein